MSLDTETTGPNFREGDRPFSVSMCWPGEPDDFDNWKTRFWSWPVDPFSRKVTIPYRDIAEIKHLTHTHRVVFHNAKFDVAALESIGITISWWRGGIYPREIYEDTLLASHVCDSGESHKLKDLALKYLDISDDDEKDLQDLVIKLRREAKKLDWNIHPSNPKMDYWLPAAMALEEGSKVNCQYDISDWSERLEVYNVLDAKRTMALWLMYYTVMNEEGLYEQYCRERKLQPVVYQMEKLGVTVRRSVLNEELARYSENADEHERTCQRIAYNRGVEELNIRSYPQLSEFMFGKLKMTTDVAGTSTDKDALQLLIQKYETGNKPIDKERREFLHALAAYRQNHTAVGYLGEYAELIRYTPYLDSDNRWVLHPSFNQTGTQTTRFSSSRPNAQNVGKGKEDEDGDVDFILRKVFGPSSRRLWYSYDYNQLQLRIFATLAGETALLDGFEAGYDAHDTVAARIFDMTVPELLSLPGDQYKLKRRIGKNTNFGFIFGAGEKKIEHTSGIKGLSAILAKQFPHATEYMDKTLRHVARNGWVKTPGGYRLTVPKDRPYAGVCYIVQGCEGEIVKDAMISTAEFCYKVWCKDAWLTLQVHDELVFDLPVEGDWKTNTKKRIEHLRHIAYLMQLAGANYGIKTPVSCEQINTGWDAGKKIELTNTAPKKNVVGTAGRVRGRGLWKKGQAAIKRKKERLTKS